MLRSSRQGRSLIHCRLSCMGDHCHEPVMYSSLTCSSLNWNAVFDAFSTLFERIQPPHLPLRNCELEDITDHWLFTLTLYVSSSSLYVGSILLNGGINSAMVEFKISVLCSLLCILAAVFTISWTGSPEIAPSNSLAILSWLIKLY